MIFRLEIVSDDRTFAHRSFFHNLLLQICTAFGSWLRNWDQSMGRAVREVVALRQ